MNRERLRRALRLLLSASFVAVGVAHFVRTDLFVAIMPPQLPWHRALVLISGACEILGGLGVLIPALRRAAGIGLIALLIAVFPANIHMAVNEVYVGDMPRSPLLLWLRLPFQFVFMAWVWWCAIASERVRKAASAP